MATYVQGATEDDVIKTTEISQDLDLTVFIQKFQSLKSDLQALPDKKTVPDQESMNHWNDTVYVEGQDQKRVLDDQVIELYNEATAIKDARLLPSKYDDEYEQLENYVNNLS